MGEGEFNYVSPTLPSLVDWNIKNAQQVEINIKWGGKNDVRAWTHNLPRPPALIP